MKTSTFIIAIVSALAIAPCAMAKKIASDNFDSYTPGSTLVGNKGGKGAWKSPWTGRSEFVTITNAPEDVVTLTLDNGEVRGGGNALKISGARTGREHLNVLERRIPEMKGPDLFVSLLFKIKNDDQIAGGNDGKPITNTNLVQWFAEDDTHEFLKDLAAFIGWKGKAGARLAEIDEGSTMPERLVAGRTYHLVIKYTGWNKTKDGRYQWCRIWINPSVNDEYTQKKSITYARIGRTAGYGSKGIRGLYVNTLGLNDSGKYHLIDDIRLGTTWADVVGKPKK
ncbi:hypothetical protein [Ereboglobus luteus]|uniref:Uncharacterized protein n=1 Tax=Ereboglobus luteus TaxID=1796921 RepID=A0A2U8E4J0_9BACT|nr:hypothetical protein [Ereboglobus luteus]AWI09685.1 hypothetical protein CKA38_10865 [Ereboglobus luteus]